VGERGWTQMKDAMFVDRVLKHNSFGDDGSDKYKANPSSRLSHMHHSASSASLCTPFSRAKKAVPNFSLGTREADSDKPYLAHYAAQNGHGRSDS